MFKNMTTRSNKLAWGIITPYCAIHQNLPQECIQPTDCRKTAVNHSNCSSYFSFWYTITSRNNMVFLFCLHIYFTNNAHNCNSLVLYWHQPASQHLLTIELCQYQTYVSFQLTPVPRYTLNQHYSWQHCHCKKGGMSIIKENKQTQIDLLSVIVCNCEVRGTTGSKCNFTFSIVNSHNWDIFYFAFLFFFVVVVFSFEGWMFLKTKKY